MKTVQNLDGKHHLVINCQASKTKNLSKPRWTAPAKTDRDGDHDNKKVTMFATVVQVGSFLYFKLPQQLYTYSNSQLVSPDLQF